MRIQSLTIIIPCYNEVSTVSEVIKKIQRLQLGIKKEIIIVDDGSTDGSKHSIQLLSSLKNTKTFFHTTNQGKGAAIKTALAHATGEFVIIQDADSEQNPHDIQRLLAYAQYHGAHAVFGSRNKRKLTWLYLHYSLGGTLLTHIANALFTLRLTDITCGYKLIQRTLLQAMDLKNNRFAFCTEVTANLACMGVTIGEIPVKYYPRTFQQGKKIRFIDWWDSFCVLLHVFHAKRFSYRPRQARRASEGIFSQNLSRAVSP
jgi:dolichol-phosphate mannosyltransferase